MRIAILGTGTVGQTIGTKLVQIGHEVFMGSREAALAIEDQLAEKDVTGKLDDHVRAVARRVTGIDDDDAAVGELGLHAVAHHAQGVGFERAAAVLGHLFSFCACA